MTEFEQIDAQRAKTLIDQGAALADIRDPESFSRAHIPGAVHLDNSNLQQFVEESDLDLPLVVYCYHGLSSQSAAQFLISRGFEEVYSLAGGFEGWQQQFPQHCQQAQHPDREQP
ncbi:thiosulfate sulfurtransferase GlpE [Motiliproteus sp.]|uniref:thiosulfate sulfurtransferase GlpE n=1 Tax=Motiliproteus sp. TaxID=1898955 RepID=UPI003BAA7FD7